MPPWRSGCAPWTTATVLAGEGVVTVALDDDGHLVRYDPDGSTTPLD